MHNVKELRKNLEYFRKKFLERNFDFKIEEFNSLDNKNRKLISEKEKFEQEKKILSKSKDKSNFEKSKKISKQIEIISKNQIEAQKKLDKFLHVLPNLASEEVPKGKDEKSNKIIGKFGSKESYLLNLSHISKLV